MEKLIKDREIKIYAQKPSKEIYEFNGIIDYSKRSKEEASPQEV